MSEKKKPRSTGLKLLLLSILLCVASFIPALADYGPMLLGIGALILVVGIIVAVTDAVHNRRLQKEPVEQPAQTATVTRYEQELQARQKAQTSKWAEIDAIPAYEFTPLSTPVKRNNGYDAVTFSNITPKGKYDDIVVFDTETTGLSASRDRIVELAAIRYVNGKAVSKFHTYINPERPIPPDATKINHITDEMVADSPVIGAVLPAFDEFIGDSTLVAHNLNFDLRFIYYSGSHVFDTKRKFIDTLEQAQKLVKKPRDVEDHKLDTLCHYYGITIAHQHSALADAYATGELFYCLVNDKQSI